MPEIHTKTEKKGRFKRGMLTFALFAAILTSCGQSNSQLEAQATADPDAPVLLTADQAKQFCIDYYKDQGRIGILAPIVGIQEYINNHIEEFKPGDKFFGEYQGTVVVVEWTNEGGKEILRARNPDPEESAPAFCAEVTFKKPEA